MSAHAKRLGHRPRAKGVNEPYDSELTFEQLRARMRAFAKERDWDQVRPALPHTPSLSSLSLRGRGLRGWYPVCCSPHAHWHTRCVTAMQFHSPRNIMLAMTGEVGELAELFQYVDYCHSRAITCLPVCCGSWRRPGGLLRSPLSARAVAWRARWA